jgi:diguanylate cyclase (GGDEF)-like protein
VIRIPGFVRESSEFVRRLLVVYWIGACLLLGLSFLSLRMLESRQRMVDQVDDIAALVESALSIAPADLNRQALIEAYSRKQIDDADLGLDVLFVVNREGRIIYSSRPAWLNLMIFDGLFGGATFDNRHFNQIVSCFRASQADCVSLRSDDFASSLASFTASRAVSQPSIDLGLPREPFLLVAVYSGNIALSALVQDFLPLLLLAILLAGVLTAALWLVMRWVLLPRLSRVAQTDGLTKLMNRAAFMEYAMDLLAEAEERGDPLVFAIMDVDHFKRINDTYGHDCGDVALVSVSAVLATVMREDDHVCRFGGEEFALLLAVDQEPGRKVLERLRLQLEMSRVAYDGREIPVTVSIGAASTTECGYNLDYLYTSADRSLYVAKQGGRNRVEWAKTQSVGRLQFGWPSVSTSQASEGLPPAGSVLQD